MARWAIGSRIPGSTDVDIIDAFTQGEIIRTHLLRPTWHFVAAEDVHWLLELTAPQTRAGYRARDRQLGLTEATFTKSNKIIENALNDSEYLTREDILARLQKAGIEVDQNRSAHLLARAELEKIICSGPIIKEKPTYALLSRRVSRIKRLTREESLATLARKYFTSRSPARLQDFLWWSGLPAKDAKLALDLIKSDFHAEELEENTYWIPNDQAIATRTESQVYLLPPYDELIVSYSDRSAPIPEELEDYMKEISDRGVFRPIIVVEGKVAGIWKRAILKERVSVEINLFTGVKPAVKARITNAATVYGAFLGKTLEITLSSQDISITGK